MDTEQASPQSASTETRHKCYLCSRTYERPDHLSRHMRSHENERQHRCSDCGKGFNRADLLNRHRAAHSKTSSGEVFRRRTPKACVACIKAKTKCCDERPCKRCRTREIVCQESEGHLEYPPDPSGSRVEPAGNPETQLATPLSLPRQSEEVAVLQDSFADLTQFPVNGDPFATVTSMADLGFPDFFEQIMMADPGPHDDLLMPPNVSDFTQDINVDTLDFDFSFLSGGLTRPSTSHGFREDGATIAESNFTTQSDAHLRSEVFNKSPWSWNHWIPERNHNAFTGQEEINVQEDRVDASDQHVSPSVKRSAHCELRHEARDRMIRVITQTASSRLAMPSFPSLDLLEDLIDVFLLQDSNAINTFIHAPSFAPHEARTELLLAMVAAGSRYIALPQVWRMGLIIQEVTRLALSESFEADNSSTRELESLQTYLLWLQVGVWSGYRRKTEIACSFLQPCVTMIAWSSTFTRFPYKDVIPYAEDSDELLDAKWRGWLEQEGRKRMVTNAFLHDSQVAIAHSQSRLVSPAQMSLPVPASLDLWLAPNAHAWRNTFLALQPPSQSQLPSMMEVFSNLGTLDSLGRHVDKPLCVLTACHALAYEVWQFREQAQLLSQNQSRRDRWLAHLNRQRDLLEDLTTLSTYCELNEDTSTEILFTVEFLIMSLHVSLEDIQVFSGKSGEEEARKVYPRVRSWTENAESRTAVWHAGQVLRLARVFEKTKLRDFYAVAVYQATLTLWVYGMVTSNTARRSGGETPVNRQPNTFNTSLTPTNRVFIDSINEKAAKSFKLLGQSTPGLKAPTNSRNWSGGASDFCSLHNSKGVMLVAEEILKRNFPESRNGLPPLVANLANLMGELGRLAGR